MRWLPYLPSLAEARARRPTAGLDAHGPAARPHRRGGPARCAAATLKRTPIAPLAAGFGRRRDVRGAWLRALAPLWPRRPTRRRRWSDSCATSPRCGASIAPRRPRRRPRTARAARPAAAERLPPQSAVARRGRARTSGSPRSTSRSLRGAVAVRRAARRAGAPHEHPARPAHWFELLTSREELGAALDCLAHTGSVQLQAYSRVGVAARRCPTCAACSTSTKPWRAATRTGGRRRTCTPPDARVPAHRSAARSASSGCVPGLRKPIRSSPNSRASRSRAPRRSARADCSALGGDDAAAARSRRGGGPAARQPRLRAAAGGPPLSLPPAVHHAAGRRSSGEVFLIAVGPRRTWPNSTRRSPRARRAASRLPAGPAADPPTRCGAYCSGARAHSTSASGRRARRWRARRSSTGSPTALGELALAAWVVAHVPELPVTEHFAWVTGWCSDARRRAAARRARRARTALPAAVHRRAGRRRAALRAAQPALGAAVRGRSPA